MKTVKWFSIPAMVSGSQPYCFSGQCFDIGCINVIDDDSTPLRSTGSDHGVDVEWGMIGTDGNTHDTPEEVELSVA
jgi:hypothetical protein